MRSRILTVLFVLALLGLTSAVGCGGGTNESTTTSAAGSEATSAQTTETGGPATGETITLKYAFFAPANSFPAVQMEKWADEVEKRTNGRVKVETFPGGTLLTAKNMYDGVLQGVADIGLSCPTYEPGRFPLLSLNDLPGLYPNAKVAGLTFYDLIQEFKPAELDKFKVITAFATEPGYIATVKKVASLADLKGMEIRSPGGPKALEALGAASVGMPMSEVGQSLQTGVIDGYLSSREVLKDFKFAEKTKYVADYPLGVISFAALMSKEKWDSLPADVQKVIDDLGAEMSLFAGSYLDDHVKESMTYAQGQGVTFVTLSDAEKAKWDAALQPLEQTAVSQVAGAGLPAEDFLGKLREKAAAYAQQYK
ncbi:MAG: TRAP transporter substrate-binding protein [Actinobacteria bacterium]|nr:TRAP transporter substrate-binding protein [Actinomycetota bacterium]